MFPVLFRIGDFTVTTFGLMMFLSFITGAWILSLGLKRRGINPEVAWDILAWCAIGGILGAKLYYLALHWNDLVADPMGEILSRGGLVWYGGLIGGVAAFYWKMKQWKQPLALTFDAVAPALMLAYAVGRLGCFLVGDDYGVPTESWVGVKFPEGAPPSTAENLRALGADIPASVPPDTVLAVHPTQLYEVGAALILFAVLWQLGKRALRPGRLFAVYLALYGVERFFIEFVRAKGDRFVLGLSTSQLMSLLLLGLAAFLWQKQANAQYPAPAATTPAGSPRPSKARV